MIAADTNVWARAYLNDDVEQARKARAAIKAGRTDDGVFVPVVVLAELYWVLSQKWPREDVLRTLENLLSTDGVVVESAQIISKALEEATSGSGGFADLVIKHVSLANGVDAILTFDKRFGRLQKVRRLS